MHKPQLAQMLAERGLSQPRLADALGLSQASVSRRLAGKTAWKVSELAQLAVLLDTTPARILEAVSE
jgi:predicted transcriptional regulator